ncbi:MAG: hypothetical protein LBD95_04750 [Clostridiales Family XIII bacterium]|jgi:hypothetical protein|nr:hypothetical protein [Clostridiales Family XIII bacterium]
MKTDNFPHYSGMRFVPDNVYVIETSAARLTCGDGIRSVEFICIKGNNLLFVEAKTTVADPDRSPKSYRAEIDVICEKFIHSLNPLSAVKVGVVTETLPADFDYGGKVSLTFVLVVRNHDRKWCRPIKRAIEQSLPLYITKIWRPIVLVLNKDVAQEHQLVG